MPAARAACTGGPTSATPSGFGGHREVAGFQVIDQQLRSVGANASGDEFPCRGKNGQELHGRESFGNGQNACFHLLDIEHDQARIPGDSIRADGDEQVHLANGTVA